MAPDLDAGTYRFEGTGYDGQFYRYLAHGFGQRDWINVACITVEMLFLALGAYWSARMLARRGRDPLRGLMLVVVPATLASFDRRLV